MNDEVVSKNVSDVLKVTDIFLTNLHRVRSHLCLVSSEIKVYGKPFFLKLKVVNTF